MSSRAGDGSVLVASSSGFHASEVSDGIGRESWDREVSSVLASLASPRKGGSVSFR